MNYLYRKNDSFRWVNSVDGCMAPLYPEAAMPQNVHHRHHHHHALSASAGVHKI